MAYNSTQLDTIIRSLLGVVKYADLRSKEWDRQTDAIKMQFANAQMFSENKERFFLFDVHISEELKHEAVIGGTKFITQFFNKRCHDKGLTCPRLAIIDTKKSRAQGGVNGGFGNMHVHGGALVPEGKNKTWLRDHLREVFGFIPKLDGNRHQMRIHPVDTDQHSSFQDRKGSGVSGRTNYILSHVGTTYNDLKLNDDGKRKRRAPLDRARVNKNSSGLAKGIPTNFCSEIMLWDNQSRASARSAFNDWVNFHKEVKPQIQKLQAA